MKYGSFFGLGILQPEVYGDFYALSGTVGDARDMATIAGAQGYTSGAKFSGVNLVDAAALPWVYTEDATADAWIAEHRRLQLITRPGDWVMMGFSGHGSRTLQGALVPSIETLCFFDRQMTDVEQHGLYCDWTPGVNVLYAIDSCHAGGMDRLFDARSRGLRSKVLPPWAPRFVSTAVKSGEVVANVVLLLACAANETAGDGPTNGSFTSCLLSVWSQMRDAGRVITANGLYQETQGLMNRYFPDQHPQLRTLGGGEQILDVEL